MQCDTLRIGKNCRKIMVILAYTIIIPCNP